MRQKGGEFADRARPATAVSAVMADDVPPIWAQQVLAEAARAEPAGELGSDTAVRRATLPMR